MAKKIHFFMALLIATVFLVNFPGTCLAQPVDHPEINKEEMSSQELTADQQGETKEDLEITQKIRRAVVTDKTLSMAAHNVKIITVAGIVTLKGPVRSEEERRSLEEKAAQIAGSGNVMSEMEIIPQKTGQ